MKDKSEVGRFIRTLREENGMSQGDLGGALGVEPQTVSKWENGVGYPDITLFEAIARYFGLSMNDMMECILPGNRKTVKAQKEVFAKREQEFATALKANSDLRNLVPSLEHVFWEFDPDEDRFVDTVTGFPFDLSIYREAILRSELYFRDPRLMKFVIKHFDLPYSEDFLKHGKSYRYGVGFLCPLPKLDKKYAQKTEFEFTWTLPVRFHPQLALMTNTPSFEHNAEILQLYLESHAYTFEMVQAIGLNPLARTNAAYFKVERDAATGQPVKKLNDRALQIIANLDPRDAFLSLKYLYRNLLPDPLIKTEILKRIHDSIDGRDAEKIHAGILAYVELWPQEKKVTDDLLESISEMETLAKLGETYGMFPHDNAKIGRILETSKSPNDIVLQLVARIQQLDAKLDDLSARVSRIEKYN